MAAAGYTIARRSPPWLHGPASDVLLGAGLLYVLSLPVLWWIGSAWGLQGWPTEAVIVMAFAANAPHYGATLLRVYEQPADRRKYAFFTIYVSLALLLVFVAGLKVGWIGALLIMAYLTWSPWHFGGQNYGLSVMFLRRSGSPLPSEAKRALHTVFVLTSLVPMIVFHSTAGAAFAPDFSADDRAYDVLRLGIPLGFTEVVVPFLVLGALATFAFSVRRLRQAGTGGDVLGLVGLIALTQLLWFIVPAWFAVSGRPLEDLAFAAVWASTAHSVQYLWVTSYYARRTGSDQRVWSFYAKAVLAGALIAVGPGVLAARVVGSDLSWSGGLAILVFSVVNLHHFILDGAIWKLRDGRVARMLLRNAEAGEEQGAARHSPLRAVVWVAGLACLFVPFTDMRATRAVRTGDVARLEEATRQLAWFGRERISVLSTLGELYAGRGDLDQAEEVLRRALAVKRDPTVMNNLAWVLSVQGGDPARASEAVDLAEAAVRGLGPEDYQALDTLAAAYAAAGRYADARTAATRAVELARADDAGLAAPLESRLALYQSDRPFRVRVE